MTMTLALPVPRPVRLLLLLLLGTLPLFAEDELEVARGLVEKGETEAARAACLRLRQDPAVSGERCSEIDWLLVECLRREAEREPDLARRAGLAAHVLDALESWLRDYPQGKRRDEADLAAAEIRLERAARFAARADASGRERAALEVLAALSSLDRVLEGYRDDPARSVELVREARYLRASASLYRATLLPADDPGRADLLARADHMAEELALELGPEAVAFYELVLLRARALDLAGKPLPAATVCDTAISFLAKEDSERARSVAVRGYGLQVGCLARAGQPERVVRAVQEMRRLWPGPALLKLPEGRDAVLEEAGARWALGQPAAAVALALELARLPGPPALPVHRFLTRSAPAALARGIALPPDTLLAGAEALFAAGDYRAALAAADAAYQAAGAADDPGPGAAAALHRRALAYAALGLPLEAAIAFERVAAEFPASPLAAPAQARAIECLAGLPPDAFARSEFDRALAALLARFPASPEVRGVLFLSARRAEEAARAGQVPWLAAAEAYDKVPLEAGENYDRARFRGAWCRYRHAEKEREGLIALPAADAGRAAGLARLGDLYRAIAGALEAYLKDPYRGAAAGQEPDVSAAELARERAERSYLARETLARVALERLGEPARAEAAFHDAEVEYANDVDRLGRAWSFVLQARLDAGDLPGACTVFRDLERRCAEVQAARVARGARALAAACRAAADSGKAAEPAAERARAAEYFSVWADLSVRGGLPITPAEVAAVATLNLERARAGADLEAARRAETLFRLLLEGRPPGPAARERWSLARDLAECLGLRRRWDEARALLEPELAAHPEAPLLYETLGQTYLALADLGRIEYRDRALQIATALLERAERGSRPWWSAKVLAAEALFRRKEFGRVSALIRDLRLSAPDLDGGKFGAREALTRLEQALPR